MYSTTAANIAKKIGEQTTQLGTREEMMNQPGTLSDSLATAMKALLTYTKLAMQRDPQDPDVKLVRSIIQQITKLVAKDQSEKEGEVLGQGMVMGQEGGMRMMGGGTTGGDMMTGAPQMPDLNSIVREGGGMVG